MIKQLRAKQIVTSRIAAASADSFGTDSSNL